MLTIHAGLHKTGTTSIQTALEIAKGHIRRRQVYLRWTDLFVTDGTIDEATVPALRRLSQRGWHSVLSSEGALGAMSHVYPDADNVASRLVVLLEGIPFRMVVYLRPQHQWAASAFTQHVKEGGTDHPHNYVDALLRQPNIRYTKLVDTLCRRLGTNRLIVRPYGGRTDAVVDFFATAGLGPVPAYIGHLRANASISADQVLAIRVANVSGAQAPAGLSAGSNLYGPERSPLPEESQIKLHDLFRADWTDLADRVAALPGHDRREFDAVMAGEEGWRPHAYANEAQVSQIELEEKRVARESESADIDSECGQSWSDGRRRWEFRLRHGPRQAVLGALTRP